MKRPAALVMTLIAVASLAAAGLAAPKTDYKRLSSPPGLYGGTLVSSMAGEPATFNPLAANDPVSQTLIGATFDGLLEVNPKTLAVEPALAEKWSISRDGLIWTFTLRTGVNWSDGTPVTAEDVVFSFNTYALPGPSNPLRKEMAVDGLEFKVEAVDSRTVRLVLNHPSATLAYELPPVLPRRILEQPWKEGRLEEIWKADGDLGTVLGTGPFIPVDYQPGSHVTFKRNQYHWRADRAGKPLPYADRWIVHLVRTRSDVLSGFMVGDTDWAPVPASAWDTLRKKETAGRYTCIDAGTSADGVFLTFNQNPDSPVFAEQPHLYGWFKSIEFRQAIACSIDQRAIINEAYGGRGTERWSPVSPLFADFYNPRVPRNTHNAPKAAALFKAIGLKMGNDKVLHDSNGGRAELTLIFDGEDPDIAMAAQIIAKQLAKAGVKLNLTPMTPTAMDAALRRTFMWQAAVVRVPGHPEAGSLRDIWQSSGSLHFWQPAQTVPDSSWEADMDDWLARAARTTDRRDRAKLYAEWQDTVAQYLPVIPLPAPNTLYAVRSRIKGAVVPKYGGTVPSLSGFWIGFTP